MNLTPFESPNRRDSEIPLHGCLLLALWLASLCSFAQTSPPLITGLLYYAVEDLNNSRVVQRGTAGSQGVAFDQLILAPNTRYRIWILRAENLEVGDVELTTPRSGQRFAIPAITIFERAAHDTDADSLSDLGEFIMGTDPRKPDTDEDGIPDGAEVRQGLNPLSGRAVRTGVIATADTPGLAVGVAAFNDLAVIADSAAGISVFNVFNGMSPIIIAQVDTPGNAVAVDFAGGFVAVADSQAGLVIVDISDPPNARIVHRLILNAPVFEVAAAGPLVYAAAGRNVFVVDMASGVILDQRPFTETVDALSLAGDHLFVLTRERLHLFETHADGLANLSNLPVAGTVPPLETGRKLSAGGGRAHVGFFTGYSVIDVSNPFQPRLIGSPPQNQAAVHDIAVNGSGLVLAVTSFSGPASLQVSLYDGSDPTDVTRFITAFNTPGTPRGLSVYNGLAYVADGNAGLQVINYLAFDSQGVPPSVTLSSSAADGLATESQLLRVTANVTDDVQVRNVEFYVDGVKAATDGNFPFEYRFVTPRIAAGRTFVAIRARASDTGGNATFSEELVLRLVPDGIPPRVTRVTPGPGNVLRAVTAVSATFNEPLDPNSIVSGVFKVFEAGADGIPGTTDDLQMPAGTLSYRDELHTVFLEFSAPLGPGVYQARVESDVRDLAGNSMTEPMLWTFRLFDLLDDRDGDGIPDEIELLLGLNPDNPDTNGNGIGDGFEDFDNDGLFNTAEIIMGTDPRNPDTNGNGILDGAEDMDNDGLADGREFALGVNPFEPDSDFDGWNDEAEVTAGSDPSSGSSRPRLAIVAATRATAAVLDLFQGSRPRGMIVAPTPAGAVVLDLINGPAPRGMVVAPNRPEAIAMGFTNAGDPNNLSVFHARPPVQVELEGP